MNDPWKKNCSLTEEGKKSIDKVLERCNPLAVYREVEQLGKIISKRCPNPNKLKYRELQKLFNFNSITPEMYDPSKRPAAYIETYCIIRRAMKEDKDEETLLTIDKNRIKDYFNKVVQEFRGKIRRDSSLEPWIELAEKWALELAK